MTDDRSLGLLQDFQAAVWGYYRASGRHDLPWRALTNSGSPEPYAVLVSELMLQQTQVPRVVPKFLAFMAAFPTIHELAAASLADVLRLWSGLGYNRRAKFLWQAAGHIVHDHEGRIPDARESLVALPGVGPNTAGAILAYAYNQPVVYVETNIRGVYIHHFFPERGKVSDTELVPLIAATLPPDQPREWYWALMDYGTHLKQTVGNTTRASTGYTKQSAFHGSRRKIRGQVLKALSIDRATYLDLQQLTNDERLPGVLEDLNREGFISQEGTHYMLRA